jgi:hypothetical protein
MYINYIKIIMEFMVPGIIIHYQKNNMIRLQRNVDMYLNLPICYFTCRSHGQIVYVR